jgi:hypothetical protein
VWRPVRIDEIRRAPDGIVVIVSPSPPRPFGWPLWPDLETRASAKRSESRTWTVAVDLVQQGAFYEPRHRPVDLTVRAPAAWGVPNSHTALALWRTSAPERTDAELVEDHRGLLGTAAGAEHITFREVGGSRLEAGLSEGYYAHVSTGEEFLVRFHGVVPGRYVLCMQPDWRDRRSPRCQVVTVGTSSEALEVMFGD